MLTGPVGAAAATVAAGILGRVDTAPSEEQMQFLDPKVRVVWWVGSAVSLLPILVGAIVLGVVVGGWGWIIGGGVLLAAITAAVLLPILRYGRWRYVVREDDIWVRRGLVWITTTVIPFSRLQFVDTTQGPIDRMLGLSSLVLHTAAVGSSTAIPGLPTAEAEGLRSRLSDVDPDVISV
ncbi:PH domain-containing protein [Euzebya tangerina]|uniref:PH domain-containing protein n=1 Tax=Euzebya tangerina TaxID=591198 RepID=UPI0013C367C8|nr:PH domain-containing protein [Euzebya tangerina]